MSQNQGHENTSNDDTIETMFQICLNIEKMKLEIAETEKKNESKLYGFLNYN